jgi:hypothetical protein
MTSFLAYAVKNILMSNQYSAAFWYAYLFSPQATALTCLTTSSGLHLRALLVVNAVRRVSCAALWGKASYLQDPMSGVDEPILSAGIILHKRYSKESARLSY